MVDLDYAFVADFAKVDPNGTLSVIGASFTHLRARQLPAAHRMAVAGRVRAEVHDAPPSLRVDIRGPSDVFKLGATGLLHSSPDVLPYADGRVGLLFALDVQVPLPSEGLYTVHIALDDIEVRRLAFDVVLDVESP